MLEMAVLLCTLGMCPPTQVQGKEAVTVYNIEVCAAVAPAAWAAYLRHGGDCCCHAFALGLQAVSTLLLLVHVACQADMIGLAT